MHTIKHNQGDSLPNKDDKAFPTLQLDPDKYREHLNELEITDEQASEFLQVLWNIMHTMVDLGMGLDSVQMFLTHNDENAVHDSGNDLHLIESKNSFNSKASLLNKEI